MPSAAELQAEIERLQAQLNQAKVTAVTQTEYTVDEEIIEEEIIEDETEYEEVIEYEEYTEVDEEQEELVQEVQSTSIPKPPITTTESNKPNIAYRNVVQSTLKPRGAPIKFQHPTQGQESGNTGIAPWGIERASTPKDHWKSSRTDIDKEAKPEKPKPAVVKKLIVKKKVGGDTTPKTAAKVTPPEPEIKPKKTWIPMRQRSADTIVPSKQVRHPDDPVPKTTCLQPVLYKPRPISNKPPSSEGQETPMEKIIGKKLYRDVKFTKNSTLGYLHDQEFTMLYFSAGWQPQCKAFTPKLIDFYRMVTNESNIECVYISVDRTLFEFKDVFATMPWPAMPTKTAALKNEMAKQLKIIELPALAVLHTASGDVVTTKGVEDVESLPHRDKEKALDLVKKWKKTKPVPASKIKVSSKLRNGNLARGVIYWQE